MRNATTARRRMVESQLEARGVADPAVLRAMEEVPRDRFVPGGAEEFAYEDSPLPIGEGQTISQPYIVAVMTEALELEGGDRVLDVGTGSGYHAAVLSRVAGEVFSVERHRSLAEAARRRFEDLGYENVRVRVGDGTLGWEEHAPYDAIVVAAGGPDVPDALLEQLAPGGRMVIPTGPSLHSQSLLRLRRTGEGRVEREDLGAVRFVPLVGAGGWSPREAGEGPPEGAGSPASTAPTRGSRPRWSVRPRTPTRPDTLADRVGRTSEPFEGVDSAPLEGLLRRIGDARVVLLGEATHGTSEFYRMRTAVTRALVERKGFRIVAVEADWPDAAWLDARIRGVEPTLPDLDPFTRFPTWMWANREVGELMEWMRDFNDADDPGDAVRFHGLDLYSMYTSIEAVLAYLDDVDPEAAEVARRRYGCLTPWEADAATYGRAVLTGGYRRCEDDVVATLGDMLEKRLQYVDGDTDRFLEAVLNARLVADAERYYRVMYQGSRDSWNLRDQHMFDVLETLLAYHGPDSKAVVWEHNSHIGDASATEMGARGQHNVGQLAREAFGDGAYLVGFGTHGGTVAAAHDWGEPMEVMDVRPSHERSYERVCHDTGRPSFLLPLRDGQADDGARSGLLEERLERAIGVIYRPDTELASHYFAASLPRQFDEYVWFDRSRAVDPFPRDDDGRVPDTFPFAL